MPKTSTKRSASPSGFRAHASAPLKSVRSWKYQACRAKKTNQGDTDMRFMMIVKASKDSEAGVLPSEKLMSAMMKYNEQLAKAGVLLDLSGLQASSKGARIKFS